MEVAILLSQMIKCPVLIEPSWQIVLQDELEKPYFLKLLSFVEKERFLGKEIYPPKDLVFNAFWKTPFDKVKVVIVGQDPYHGPGQAHGLCFSVGKDVPPPPSLINIFKELAQDTGFNIPSHGSLVKWAEQGVFLLNATLTVADGDPMSHHGKGWELFTDAVIQKLSERKEPLIFVLWGRSAKEKVKHVAEPHAFLEAPHPSPLSASKGFFGCRHFSKINQILSKWGKTPIDWQI